MTLELKQLLNLGVVEKCSSTAGFLSRMFLISKTNGKLRQIFDLRRLNAYLNPPKFRLVNQNQVPDFLHQGDYLGKLDISQAYFHIPIKHSHRRYLAFAYAGQLFQMTSLPFGLSSASLAFSRISKWVASLLRQWECAFLFISTTSCSLTKIHQYWKTRLCRPSPKSRLVHKHRKVRHESNSMYRISRDSLGHRKKQENSSRQEGRSFIEGFKTGNRRQSLDMAIRDFVNRTPRLCLSGYSFRSTAHQAHSACRSKAAAKKSVPEAIFTSSGSQRLPLVGSKREDSWKDFSPRTYNFYYDRCCRQRLGCLTQRLSFMRSLIARTDVMAHKQKGTIHRKDSTNEVSGYCVWSVNNGAIRQQDSRFLLEKPRRDKICSTARDNEGDTYSSKETGSNTARFLFTRALPA